MAQPKVSIATPISFKILVGETPAVEALDYGQHHGPMYGGPTQVTQATQTRPLAADHVARAQQRIGR